ncbi:MATE family efflux transporter [Chthonobacter rhizosphaerae]|uniref:MATE family efflux transporter n=1 Tax=Chthonobacter rhizosphaerae TaxID=2735553 RepID=UPI0015EF8209|nr:MATE family efflux transporter [Chthonobacter rhizosphaerae]
MPPTDVPLLADDLPVQGRPATAAARPARETWAEHAADTLRLSAPISMGHLSFLATMTATLALFGSLAPAALPAGGLSLRMSMSGFVMAGILIVVGVAVAEAQGARRTGSIPGLYWNGLYLTGVLSAVSFAWFTYGHHVLTALDQPPDVVRQTDECMRIMRWAEPANVLRLGLMRTVLPAFGLARVLYVLTPLSLALYVLLAWALVDGHLGLPALGWQGIAWAFVISTTLSALAMLATVHGTRFRKQIPFTPPSLAHLGAILRPGLPIGLQMTVDSAFFLIMTLLMGQLGAVAIAAHQIVHNFGTICYVLAASCGDAAALRISYRRGARRFHDATLSGYVAFVLGMAGMAGAALVIYVFPEVFIGLFIDIRAPENAEVLAFALSLIPVCALYVLADGFYGVGMGLQRGLNDNTFTFWLVTVSYWAVGFPVGYGLLTQTDLGAHALWWGLIAGLTAIGAGTLWRYGVLSRAAAEGRLPARRSRAPIPDPRAETS